MKKLMSLICILISLNSFGIGDIMFVKECEKVPSECEALTEYGKDKVHYGSKEVRLEVPRDAVTKARFSKDVRGVTMISIELSKEYSQRFSTLTGETIDKRLLIVVDGIVLSAPAVREAISTGKFMISIPDTDATFLEKLKWLKALSDETIKEESQEKVTKMKMMTYFLAFLVVGSLGYAFFPKKEKHS